MAETSVSAHGFLIEASWPLLSSSVMNSGIVFVLMRSTTASLFATDAPENVAYTTVMIFGLIQPAIIVRRFKNDRHSIDVGGVAVGAVDHEPPHEQGLLQGTVNSLRGGAALVEPAIVTWMYAKSVGGGAWMPAQGATFCLASALQLVGLVIASRALARDAPKAAQ